MLTEKQAFDAMIAFIKRFNDGGLGMHEDSRLLQYINYAQLDDKGEPVTGSPFAWGDWLEAVASVTAHGAPS